MKAKQHSIKTSQSAAATLNYLAGSDLSKTWRDYRRWERRDRRRRAKEKAKGIRA